MANDEDQELFGKAILCPDNEEKRSMTECMHGDKDASNQGELQAKIRFYKARRSHQQQKASRLYNNPMRQEYLRDENDDTEEEDDWDWMPSRTSMSVGDMKPGPKTAGKRDLGAAAKKRGLFYFLSKMFGLQN